MAIDKINTEPIGYNIAAQYLDNLDQNRNRINFLNSAGGTFRVKEFREWESQGEDFSGIICWFCLDEGDKFFIAIEPRFKFEYDENLLHLMKPESENLYVPPQILGNEIYEDEGSSGANLEGRLRRFKNNMWRREETETNANVWKWVQNFKEKVKNIGWCDHGFTYFQNTVKYIDTSKKSHISNFLKPRTIKMVRYFFGLAKTGQHDLRLILVPVNLTGRNIESNEDELMDENNLLQNSWPPKPSNVI